MKNKGQILLELCMIGMVAGIIFEFLTDKVLTYAAFLMGGTLGLAYGALELYLLGRFRRVFNRIPLLTTILIKSLAYILLIYIISNTIGLIVGLSEGKQLIEFYESLISTDQLVLMSYTLILFVLLSFYIQINYLLGEGVLLKFLFGKYRKPVGEHRIFMFLDMKASTTLAESLGLEKYYALLNDFFYEISGPVRHTNAEIYQYVGDEIIFTWKTDEGLADSNCLKIFFKIRESIYENRRYYREKYGDVPDFKAGLHFGEVISAQIGDIKRDIIFNGDVLNTASRIQEQCNKVDRELLISGSLLSKLDIENEFMAERIDSMQLRGKETEVEIFSMAQF